MSTFQFSCVHVAITCPTETSALCRNGLGGAVGPRPPAGQLQPGQLHLPGHAAQHRQDCFCVQGGEDHVMFQYHVANSGGTVGRQTIGAVSNSKSIAARVLLGFIFAETNLANSVETLGPVSNSVTKVFVTSRFNCSCCNVLACLLFTTFNACVYDVCFCVHQISQT